MNWVLVLINIRSLDKIKKKIFFEYSQLLKNWPSKVYGFFFFYILGCQRGFLFNEISFGSERTGHM